MLGTIVLRELMDIIKSKKYLLFMFIITLLTVVSTLFNIDDYVFRQQEYLNAVNMNRDIIRPTHILSILIQGKDAALGNMLPINAWETKLKGYLGLDSKRSNTQTEIPFDLEFIVKYLFSLMIIFLSYNVVSEDKERGTLRLALSNSVSKSSLLAGKCISHGVVIFSSTLFAFTMSMLLMASNSLIHLSGQDMIRIALLFIATNIYLILFLILSIFISTMASGNKSSLMILLQIWIIVVYLIPGLGGIVAEHSLKVPTQYEHERQTVELTYPLESEAMKIRREYLISLPPGAAEDGSGLALKRVDELFNRVKNMRVKAEREYNQKLTSQSELAFTVTQFSPAVLMNRIVNRIALTDIEEYDYFVDMAMQYRTSLPDQYQISKSSPRFDPRTTSIGKSIVDSAPFLLVMIIECLVLYVFAHVAFLRKDVR